MLTIAKLLPRQHKGSCAVFGPTAGQCDCGSQVVPLVSLFQAQEHAQEIRNELNAEIESLRIQLGSVHVANQQLIKRMASIFQNHLRYRFLRLEQDFSSMIPLEMRRLPLVVYLDPAEQILTVVPCHTDKLDALLDAAIEKEANE